jgi:hypothetical protein
MSPSPAWGLGQKCCSPGECLNETLCGCMMWALRLLQPIGSLTAPIEVYSVPSVNTLRLKVYKTNLDALD